MAATTIQKFQALSSASYHGTRYPKRVNERILLQLRGLEQSATFPLEPWFRQKSRTVSLVEVQIWFVWNRKLNSDLLKLNCVKPFRLVKPLLLLYRYWMWVDVLPCTVLENRRDEISFLPAIDANVMHTYIHITSILVGIETTKCFLVVDVPSTSFTQRHPFPMHTCVLFNASISAPQSGF